jgi:ADP-ribosyl-[dinitrogen reductase] hydrolase
MLGAIIGDIVGSIYEWENHKSKDFEFLPKRCFFTDDTVCTIAVADALLHGKPPAEALYDWCNRYPGRGYGGMFGKWIQSPGAPPYNSYGNGAAMRVSPAGFLGETLEETLAMARAVTEVTHNHPEGLKGAAATAHAIFLATNGEGPGDIRAAISKTYGYDLSRTVDGIRPAYRFNETCQQTVPEALICALDATSYEDAIRNAVSIGGDSDTVAAIAGGVAEALFGVPDALAQEGLRRLPEDMRLILAAVYGSGMAGEEEMFE